VAACLDAPSIHFLGRAVAHSESERSRLHVNIDATERGAIRFLSSMNAEAGDFRVAVVGLGKMGILHACLLSVMPEVRIAAIAERRHPLLMVSRRMFPLAHPVSNVEDLDGMDLDAVFVTTPIRSHFPICKSVLSLGLAKNLFVEKTLASNAREGQEIIRLARARGAIVMVGYQRKFGVTFRKARELLYSGNLGDLESFEAYALSSDGLRAGGNNHASDARDGVVRDLGSHAISLATWFFGRLQVEECSCEPADKSRSEHSAAVTVQGERGLIGQFQFSWMSEGYRMPEVGIRISSTNAAIEANDDFVKIATENGEQKTWYRHDLNDEVDYLLGGPEYYREDRFFVDAVNSGRDIGPELSEAVEVERIIDDALARAGKGSA